MMRIASIGGTELFVRPSALLLALIACVVGEGAALLAAAAALLLHETAHLLAAHDLGVGVRSVILWPFGACAETEGEPRAKEACIIAAAGPIASLTAGAMLLLFGSAWPKAEETLLPYCYANLFLAVGNLLPAFPLDGGRILRAVLAKRFGEPKAGRIAVAGTLLTALALLLTVLWVCLKGGSFRLWYVLPLFLILAAVREGRALPAKRVQVLIVRDAALRKGALLPVRGVAVRDSATVGELLRSTRADAVTLFYILQSDTEKPIVVDEATLLRAAARCGSTRTLKEIIKLFDLRTKT